MKKILLIFLFGILFISCHQLTKDGIDISKTQSIVQTYLQENLKDPDSYQSIDWSEPIKGTETGSIVIRHKFRAKNSFGGYTINNMIFIIKNNKVDASGDYVY